MNYNIPKPYLTIRKVLNIKLLQLSYLLSSKLKRPIIWGNPTTLDIEPINLCNLKCSECALGNGQITRKKGHIDFELYKNIIDETNRDLLTLSLFFQGEPYMNGNIFKMIQYADSKLVYTYISTNGHFLDNENAKSTVESGLKKLIISLDGVDEKTYRLYRKNGDFHKVMQGIKNVIRWKIKLQMQYPEVVIRFLVFKYNEHQIPEIYKIGKELGVEKVVIKTAQIYNYQNKQHIIPSHDEYSRYKIIDSGQVKIKSQHPNKCYRMWESSVITIEGDVVPCCFDKNSNNKLGNLYNQSFHEIWRSKRYGQFRRKIFSKRNKVDICANCSEGITY
jgi:radical SAM protein with 4Fe4S-binding SPASM domain